MTRVIHGFQTKIGIVFVRFDGHPWATTVLPKPSRCNIPYGATGSPNHFDHLLSEEPFHLFVWQLLGPVNVTRKWCSWLERSLSQKWPCPICKVWVVLRTWRIMNHEITFVGNGLSSDTTWCVSLHDQTWLMEIIHVLHLIYPPNSPRKSHVSWFQCRIITIWLWLTVRHGKIHHF